MENITKDFFISYTSSDEWWAKWIAATLENAEKEPNVKYTTIIQAWDFKAGENFVSNMHQALKLGKRFIAVMSQTYLKSPYCQAEWTAAFTKDPSMEQSMFIPVRIDDIKPDGLLAPIVYIDLSGKNG